MDTSEVKHLKGAVHLALAAAPLLEIKHSSSKLRNVLLGLAAGWHLNAAFYHFFIEKADNDNLVSRPVKNANNRKRKS